MAEAVQSPVTGGAAQLCDKFRSADLIARYRNDWGLEVADHFEGMPELSLFRCKDTGYRFFHPPTLAGEAAFYDEFWALENPNIHRPKDELRDDWQFALERVWPGDELLDVGCAEGAFLEHASQVTHAVGIDENREGCRIARDNGLEVSCSAVTDFAMKHPGKFDVVVASQVLEHIFEIAPFMAALRQLVRPGGRIILSVPNNEPYYAGWSKYEPLNNPPHHIGLWNGESLRRMADHFDLAVDELHYLGDRDGFVLQVYRRATHMADVSKGRNELKLGDWLRIAFAAPAALLLTSWERLIRSTCNYAYLSVVLRRPTDRRS